MGAGASSCTRAECVNCTTATKDAIIKTVEDVVEDVVETARDLAHDARTSVVGTYRPPSEEVDAATPEALWFEPSKGWPTTSQLAGAPFADVEAVQAEWRRHPAPQLMPTAEELPEHFERE